jgi:PAS domain S-box-containing protein
LRHAFEECTEQGKPIVAQHRLQLASGEIRWLEQAIEPMDTDDKTVGLRGTVRDITAEREAEQARRQQESCDGLTGLATRSTFRAAVE